MAPDNFVDTLTGNCLYQCPSLDDRLKLWRIRQRLQIGIDEIPPGWQLVSTWGRPSIALQDRPRRIVDVVTPGREQANVTPARDTRGDGRARLVELDGHAAFDEMRRCRQANWPSTDDGDGQ